MSYRYGAWRGGPDPLEPPFDVARALDRLGERVLAGDRAADALRGLLRDGMPGTRGLRDLLRQARDRRRELRQRGRLDGTLERVRELLDQAVDTERQALFPDPSDAARLAEAELDQLPPDTARAVRQLADYQWRSPEAAATYEQIRDLLRREVLDSQFRGMRDALAGASPEELQRIRDMVADLNAMLEADARGEDTQRAFEEFMERYGDMFPENPRSLEELVDALARRAAAASRLAASLSPEQRAELAALSRSVLGDLGLQYELDRLGRALRSRRPDLRWDQGATMGGEQPLGLGDATTALEELADLESLEASLGQRYPGASLDDIDLEAVERALGRAAVDDVETLRRLERELTEQGYLLREQGELRLTPKAIRRIGAVALRRIFSSLDEGRRGDHDVAGLGLAGEPTGASRPWTFGDEEPLDVVRTVRNAVLRGGAHRPGGAVDGRGHPASGSATVPLRGAEAPEAAFPRARTAGRGVTLAPDDFENGGPRPRSACWSTSRCRCCCGRPGGWPRRPRWPCTAWCRPVTRRTRSRSSGSRCWPGPCARPTCPTWTRPSPRGRTCTTPWCWPAGTWTGTRRPSRWSWSSPTASRPPTWNRTAGPSSTTRPTRARSS